MTTAIAAPRAQPSTEGPQRPEFNPDSANKIILVNENDRQVGIGDKIDVHRTGSLHRAFSVMLYDPAGRLLLQRRAAGKYHFAGRWSNACCSHPRPGESTMVAALRRLHEELGVAVPLTELAELTYRAEDPESGLIEHEYLHLLTGRLDGTPDPNSSEIDAWRWMSGGAVRRAIHRIPDAFTPWFRLILIELGDRRFNRLTTP